jgi:3-deoxy-7-phosphoheptulonate synthase
MIIELKDSASAEPLERLLKENDGVVVERNGKRWAVIASKVIRVPDYFAPFAERSIICKTDMQLGSREFDGGTREITFGGFSIGGSTKRTAVIAGPCSVESEEQIRSVAELLVEQGIKILRAGCYKPRTSPYSFQGLGSEGLRLLQVMRKEYGLAIITEVRDATHVEDVIKATDIIQIGAKACYDHGILKACGRARKPVLIKRGFGTTLQEFLHASEFVMSGGNFDVALCERGIRTFETKTRFTLDLCGVAFLKAHSSLPVVVDPSHAMGFAYGVPDLARASVAMGIDGLLVEVHPTPQKAKSDASQQLDFTQWRELFSSLQPVAAAVGRSLC